MKPEIKTTREIINENLSSPYLEEITKFLDKRWVSCDSVSSKLQDIYDDWIKADNAFDESDDTLAYFNAQQRLISRLKKLIKHLEGK